MALSTTAIRNAKPGAKPCKPTDAKGLFLLVRHALWQGLNAEQMKAWSQNLGHENVMTTFTRYGHVPVHKQGELIRKSAVRKDEQTRTPVCRNAGR